VEEYRFYSSNSDELSEVTIKKLALRMTNFRKINDQDIKFRAAIAGAKLK
jgi:hypothetical protein